MLNILQYFTFLQVVCDSLWQLRIVVIVKEEHKHRISHVKTSSVKTGKLLLSFK